MAMTGDRDSRMRQMLGPVAHRGLHNVAAGVIENSRSAFAAALDAGVGIECDLQKSADGEAMVFHDATLDRLTDATGPVNSRTAQELQGLVLSGAADRIGTLEDLLVQVSGSVPLFIEIKSDWTAPDTAWLSRICAQLTAYTGPAALMSFDPAVMAHVRAIAPDLLRGIVGCTVTKQDWPEATFNADRALALSDLLETGPAAPDFINYRISDLPTAVTRYVSQVQRLPVLAWTVRTRLDLAHATKVADAAVFEGLPPDEVFAAFADQAEIGPPTGK